MSVSESVTQNELNCIVLYRSQS